MRDLYRFVCDSCSKSLHGEHGVTTKWWASGDRHYCKQCWPKVCGFYDGDESYDGDCLSYTG
jgi:hypothetical protein